MTMSEEKTYIVEVIWPHQLQNEWFEYGRFSDLSIAQHTAEFAVSWDGAAKSRVIEIKFQTPDQTINKGDLR